MVVTVVRHHADGASETMSDHSRVANYYPTLASHSSHHHLASSAFCICAWIRQDLGIGLCTILARPLLGRRKTGRKTKNKVQVQVAAPNQGLRAPTPADVCYSFLHALTDAKVVTKDKGVLERWRGRSPQWLMSLCVCPPHERKAKGRTVLPWYYSLGR